ncbi:MAG: tetratricopeptide repeat protein [Phycisphaerae bacterium]
MLNVTAGGVAGVIERGRRFHAAGKLRDAEMAYRQALGIRPDHPIALNLLGAIAMQVGRLREAEACFRRAVTVDENFAEAHNHLGAVLAAQQRWEEAEREYGRALTIQPQYAEAMHNLGLLLVKTKRVEQGIAAYRRSLERMPKFAAAHYNLGMALLQEGKTEEALESHQRAVELDPRFTDSFVHLGRALLGKGRKEEAIKVMRQGMEVHPASQELRFLLSAATGDQQVKNAPLGYVAAVFEHYAPRFDEHLKFLEYRGPEYLVEAVRAAAPGRKFEMLDVGCGTGLCGVAFKEMTTRLVGVDLAAAMVARAQARGIYDEVGVGELEQLMRARAQGFDLVVAGDVFVYVGELEGVFSAVRATLRDGGLFAFTTEKAEGDRVVLREQMRYAHPLAYLEELGRRHGFETVSVAEKPLRNENANPVEGLVVVMRKVQNS